MNRVINPDVESMNYCFTTYSDGHGYVSMRDSDLLSYLGNVGSFSNSKEMGEIIQTLHKSYYKVILIFLNLD